MKTFKNKGFTLIELLVVISIIGILAAMTLTGLAAAQKSARDARRKSDLAQYRLALEGYQANNGSYVVGTGVASAGSSIFSSTGALITDYIPTVILDPRSTLTVCDGTSACNYYYFGTTALYVLYANLETGESWEVCSNGKVGIVSTTPTNESCDL